VTFLRDSSGFNTFTEIVFTQSDYAFEADFKLEQVWFDTELSSGSGESLFATGFEHGCTPQLNGWTDREALPSSDAGSIPDLCLIKVASMGFTTEHSAVNYTAEHHKPLFWRRLAIKLSPLAVPQVCPMFLAYRWIASPFPRTPFLASGRHDLSGVGASAEIEL
jgi:hypothetical protein